MAGKRQMTLALLKPDVTANPMVVERLLRKISRKNLEVVDCKTLYWSEKASKLFYGQHYKKFFYRRLVEYTTCGPIVALAVAGENAIFKWRSLVGPTKTFQACLSDPLSLRGELGLSDTRNSTHGSDSVDSASKELTNIFLRHKMPSKGLASGISTIPLSSLETWESLYRARTESKMEWLLNFDELSEYLMPIIRRTTESPELADAKVLDVGCGDSMIGPNVAKSIRSPSSVFCADFSLEALRRLRYKMDLDESFDDVKNCQLICADINSTLPFESSTMAAVIDKGAIDSIFKGPAGTENASRALTEMLRLLRREGALLQITDEPPEARVDFLQKVADCSGSFRVSCQSVPSSSNGREYFLYCVFKL